ncbi:MAG TPA: hypothetical protein VJS12_08780 [Steroidobacteraceae bacterium]|nr:hypothetical protein [Steroidobacteraceae bacterium]
MKETAAHLPDLIRSGILAALASSMVACASAPDATASRCVDRDDSFAAIKSRTIDSDVFAAYEVSECVGASDAQDVRQEACVLAVKAGEKPSPPVGWERKPITFAPIVVRDLADKRDIHIAVLYSLGDASQFYGDDDLSRAIVYQRVDNCAHGSGLQAR